MAVTSNRNTLQQITFIPALFKNMSHSHKVRSAAARIHLQKKEKQMFFYRAGSKLSELFLSDNQQWGKS